VIETAAAGHPGAVVSPVGMLPLRAESVEPAAPAHAPVPADRLTTLFQQHFDLVWRTVRRLGVPPEAIDDAAQEVFVVASRRLAAIEPGKERAFLYGTAVRVAADARRSSSRRRIAPHGDAPLDPTDPAPAPDELVEQKRARELLDELVARLPDDTRPVFVLYELEGLTMEEIASCLEVPPGTVASRLRRGREAFHAAVAKLDRAAVREEARRG
jgi:RNA polymerase sigma-70 factor (ECF subfamily)